jgi:hypothetical protein
MCMLDHRLQLLLEERQYRRLVVEAQQAHTSVASLIRAAIDEVFPEASVDRRRAAIDRVLNSPPTPVPVDPADIRRELDEAHLERFRGLS